MSLFKKRRSRPRPDYPKSHESMPVSRPEFGDIKAENHPKGTKIVREGELTLVDFSKADTSQSKKAAPRETRDVKPKRSTMVHSVDRGSVRNDTYDVGDYTHSPLTHQDRIKRVRRPERKKKEENRRRAV